MNEAALTQRIAVLEQTLLGLAFQLGQVRDHVGLVGKYTVEGVEKMTDYEKRITAMGLRLAALETVPAYAELMKNLSSENNKK